MSEIANNLLSTSYAKVLLALGEGPWEASIDGTQIYFDGTPLIDSEGNENFPGTVWDFRPGTRDQSYIQGLSSVENDISVNVELTDENDWVRSITNDMLSAVRVRLRWPQIEKAKDNGDIVGLTISYAIDVSTDGSAYETVLTTSASGKTNTTYERTHRVDLPSGSSWQIRVRRLTANSNLSTVYDTMYISAITEIIDAKFKYPNTALLYVEYDAEQFDSIPTIAVEKKMRLIRVPSNYDPETREYTGVWDGTFQTAWTNNPAWVFYDLVLNDRFGCGQRITIDLISKWVLYDIAQYCDELVSDGKGGTEPRFTCNVYIQESKEAWQVLRDISAIYRGMSYWANGQMTTVADMPSDVDYIYTNANVKEGKFEYADTPASSKYSRALVSWDNPDNEYETDTISVSDSKLQKRYGDNPIELTALGCTSEGEAQRRGKWAIFTNSNGRTVSFTLGLDGYLPLPGKTYAIADRLVAGKRIGGRISAVDGNVVTLDLAPDAAVNDRLQVNLPSGITESRTIIFIDGNDVEVSTAYSEQPEPQCQWAIESDTLELQYFRCLTVQRADSDSAEFNITAVETNPSKYNAIDNGAKLMERQISSLLSNLQSAPTSISISQYSYTEQTQSITVMTISWAAADSATSYEVEWQKDNGDWISAGTTGNRQIDVSGVFTGEYIARVRAINANGIKSSYVISDVTEITGKTGTIDTVAALTTASEIFGITLDWSFPSDADDTNYTEIQYSVSSDGSNPVTLGYFSYPQNTYTMTGLGVTAAYYFSARLVDKSGNVSAWSDWVLGRSSSDADEILDYLTDKITESQLAQSLLDPIESISAIEATAASAKENADLVPDLVDRVEAVEEISVGIPTLQSQVSILQTQVADVLGTSDWDSGTAYAIDEMVKYNNALYRSIDAVPAGTLPTNTAYWEKIGDYASLADYVNALAVDVSNVSTSIDELTGTVTSEASRLTALYSAVLQPMAGDTTTLIGDSSTLVGIMSAEYIRAAADEALSQRIEEVVASAAGNTALIQSEQTARATADEALAQDITTLQSDTADNTAAIQIEQTARTTADEALAQDITTLQSNTADNTAAIQTEQTARTTADEALAQDINTLQSDTAATNALLLTEQTARANADSALSTRVDTAQASADSAQSDADDANTAAASNLALIQAEQTARADGDSALSQSITTVQAQAVAAQSTADDAGSAAAAAQSDADDANTAAASNLALIQAEQTARADGDSALSQSITTVQAQAVAAQSTADDASSAAAAAQSDADDANTAAASNLALIQAEQTARADGDSAISANLSSVTAQVNPPMAGDESTNIGDDTILVGVYSEQYARATADEALGQQINTVVASAAANTAAIQTEQAARTTSEEAIAESISALQADVNSNGALIKSEQTARADADSALSESITTVQAQAFAAQSTANDANTAAASNLALIQAEQTARADGDSALSQSITTVQAQAVAAQSTADDASSAAAAAQSDADDANTAAASNLALIQAEQTARADGDSALSQSITTVQAQAVAAQSTADDAGSAAAAAQSDADDANTAAASNLALIQAEQTARADGDSVLSQSIATVQASAADNAAAVQDVSEAQANLDGTVSALRTIKAQTTSGGKTVMAGIVLGSDGETSEIGLFAQTFFVASQTDDGTVYYPFIIEDGLPVFNQALINTLLNKTTIQRVGNSMRVTGVGFGSNSQFIEWFGPDVGDISNCTEENATSYKTINGDEFMGGTISTGDFKNALRSSEISSTAELEMTFGSQGGLINIAVSLSCSGSFYQSTTGTSSSGTTSGTVLLERYNGSSWDVVQTLTCSGTWSIEQENTDRIGVSNLSGSMTYTDSDQTTENRQYRARVNGYSAGSVPFTKQTLTLIATENT